MSHYDIPKGLSPPVREVAKAIVSAANTFAGRTTKGAGKSFYSPEEWALKGEDFGTNAELIVTHDGGDLAKHFNYNYGNTAAVSAMMDALAALGFFSESCTSWYSAIYRIPSSRT
jgi:hypothetical protein